MFRDSIRAVFAINAGEIAVPFSLRLSNSLGEMERKAHADIASAKAAPAPSTKRLDDMRLLEKGAGQRHDDLMRQYRELQGIMAEPPPRYSWMDRALGRPAPPIRDDAALSRQHDALRAELRQTERTLLSGIAAVARAEKELAAARVERLQAMDVTIRRAEAVLMEVAQTRQMVQFYPRLAYCGPPFVIHTGQRLARRRRRGLINPQAKSIWGLPIDFG